MTIAYDPKPSAQQTPGNRYDSTGIREITDETTYEEESDEQPGPRYDPDEDWIKMFTGKKMEENY